jgi:CopG family nickel-responsive transcriptional regulator
MERFTISLDESLASQFDQLIAARGYRNRSEAVRDLIRGAIEGDGQREMSRPALRRQSVLRLQPP